MTRRGRLRMRGSGSVPVVLPHVIVRLDGVGTTTVTLDGVPVSDGPIPRVQLGEALSQIVDQLATAVRVEVHDPDGTVDADILTPPDQRPLEPARDRPPRPDRHRSPATPAHGPEAAENVRVPAPVATAAPGRRGSRNADLDPRRARERPELSPPVRAPSRRTNHLRELA